MVWKVIVFIITTQLFDVNSTSLPFSLDTITLNLSTANRKPHLNCILFGETACQISCDVLCDLYGCLSRATCVDDVSCDCGEIYSVNSRNLTVDRYRKLNLTELWHHNFGQSFISKQFLSKITQLDDDFASNLTGLLRQPHMTGIQVQKEVLRVHPEWWLMSYLRPSRRGRIDDIFDPANGISREKFELFFEKAIDSLVNRKYSQIQSMTNVHAMPSLFKYLKDDKNIRYIVSQSLWFPNNTLLDLISEYSSQLDYCNFFPATSNSGNVSARPSDAENVAFNSLKARLFQGIENLAQDLFGKIEEMKPNRELPRLTAFVRHKNDVKNLISLMLMFPNASMFDLMRNLMIQQRRTDIESDTNTVSRGFTPRVFISPSDIDELVMASVLETLLRVKLEPTTTTTTTTHEPTTTKPQTISNYFYSYVKRLWRRIFRIRQPRENEHRGKPILQPLKGKGKYPDLRVLLSQLMDHLGQATNH